MKNNVELQEELRLCKKQLSIYDAILGSWYRDSYKLNNKFSEDYFQADSNGRRRLKAKYDFYSAQFYTIESIIYELQEELEKLKNEVA